MNCQVGVSLLQSCFATVNSFILIPVIIRKIKISYYNLRTTIIFAQSSWFPRGSVFSSYTFLEEFARFRVENLRIEISVAIMRFFLSLVYSVLPAWSSSAFLKNAGEGWHPSFPRGEQDRPSFPRGEHPPSSPAFSENVLPAWDSRLDENGVPKRCKVTGKVPNKRDSVRHHKDGTITITRFARAPAAGAATRTTFDQTPARRTIDNRFGHGSGGSGVEEDPTTCCWRWFDCADDRRADASASASTGPHGTSTSEGGCFEGHKNGGYFEGDGGGTSTSVGDNGGCFEGVIAKSDPASAAPATNTENNSGDLNCFSGCFSGGDGDAGADAADAAAGLGGGAADAADAAASVGGGDVDGDCFDGCC